MTGFSSFKEAFRRINSLSDRMIERGKRGNYNVVLVNDCGANEFVFSDMLYSLLVGKGIIKDQRIVRGDLDDAVCTSSNTSLFYFIMKPGILAIMTVSDGEYRKKNRFVC